jgi:hypothetical protein
MAIKVTLGATENTQQEKPFPKLMKCINGWAKGSIVYFISESAGIRLTQSTEGDGSIPTCMEIVYNFPISNFTDYNEPITIQNQ